MRKIILIVALLICSGCGQCWLIEPWYSEDQIESVAPECSPVEMDRI